MCRSKYLCSQYGSRNCPMYGTCGMIYDICPMCENRELNNEEKGVKE